jgi:hypothetical protein
MKKCASTIRELFGDFRIAHSAYNSSRETPRVCDALLTAACALSFGQQTAPRSNSHKEAMRWLVEKTQGLGKDQRISAAKALTADGQRTIKSEK